MASAASGASAAGEYRCRHQRGLEGVPSALPGSLLFAAGLLGNGLALALLWQHHLRARARRTQRGGGGVGTVGAGRPRASAFYLLVSALATTDLLGKCLVSPIVLAAYARNRSLSELWPAAEPVEGASAESARPGRLCQLFAFLMAFFGLAPTVLLLAMALECWLSLGRPYFYERHTSRRRGALLTGGAALLCALFCALPFAGFGSTVQYCPGTWCFIRMSGPGPSGRAYAALYASLLALLALAIGACNLGSMRSLYRMARRQPLPAAAVAAAWTLAPAGPPPPPPPPRLEELGQLLLLALMTVLFAVCSLPMIIRAYVGAFAPDYDEKADLTALRFFSVNSIVDPWVFIIFRTSVFRSCLRRLSWRLSSRRATHSQLLETWPRKESDSGQ
ncbi:prostaglandin D2 receptor isoform X1 [Pogona vitticeps]